MSNKIVDGNKSCPACGAERMTNAIQCWLCWLYYQEFRDSSEAAPINGLLPQEPQVGGASAATVAGPLDATGKAQFHLSSIFLVMTLVAVCLGALRIAPGLGIAMATVAIPILVRAILKKQPRRGPTRPMSGTEKTLSILGTVGIVFLGVLAAFVAAFIAFWVVCLSVDASSVSRHMNPITCGLFAALMAAGATAIGIAIWISKRRERKSQ